MTPQVPRAHAETYVALSGAIAGSRITIEARLLAMLPDARLQAT